MWRRAGPSPPRLSTVVRGERSTGRYTLALGSDPAFGPRASNTRRGSDAGDPHRVLLRTVWHPLHVRIERLAREAAARPQDTRQRPAQLRPVGRLVDGRGDGRGAERGGTGRHVAPARCVPQHLQLLHVVPPVHVRELLERDRGPVPELLAARGPRNHGRAVPGSRRDGAGNRRAAERHPRGAGLRGTDRLAGARPRGRGGGAVERRLRGDRSRRAPRGPRHRHERAGGGGGAGRGAGAGRGRSTTRTRTGRSRAGAGAASRSNPSRSRSSPSRSRASREPRARTGGGRRARACARRGRTAAAGRHRAAGLAVGRPRSRCDSCPPPAQAPADGGLPAAASADSQRPSQPEWPAQPQWPSARSSTPRPNTILGRPVVPSGGIDALWAASSRDVVAPMATAPTPLGQQMPAAAQPCINCGLSLSSTARFCRRCGTAQTPA